MFIFVYSIDDKESFKKLIKAIADVIDETPKRKFCGILIANKNDKASRVWFKFWNNFYRINFFKEVEYDEGYQLKMKYNLSWFVETNVMIESQTSQVI